MMIKMIIPLPPITKKNSQRILVNRSTGRPFIAPSKQFEQYQKDAAYFVKPLGISEPVNIECHFYMPSKRSVDLTNLLEGIDDVLVKCGCIADDNYKIVAGHDGSRVFVDKDNPRTEVYITKAEPKADTEQGEYKIYLRENGKNRLLETFDSEDAMYEFAYYYKKENCIYGTDYHGKSLVFYEEGE